MSKEEFKPCPKCEGSQITSIRMLDTVTVSCDDCEFGVELIGGTHKLGAMAWNDKADEIGNTRAGEQHDRKC